jgi:virginiamycin B lyase
MFADGALWISSLKLHADNGVDTDDFDGTLTRIDPTTRSVTDTIAIEGSPYLPVFAAGAIWVSSSGDAPSATGPGDGTVSRIDPTTRTVTDTVPVGFLPGAPVLAGRALWVNNRSAGSVSRVDPATRTVTEIVAVGAEPGTPVFADNALWVTSGGENGTISRFEIA